ncbi:MAG: serine hydrolase [Sphingomonas sp.]
MVIGLYRVQYSGTAFAALAAIMLVLSGCNARLVPRASAAPVRPISAVPVPLPRGIQPVAQNSRPTRAPAALTASLAALSRQFDGTVGIAVHSVGDGWATSAGADSPLPQQSVSKLWVAMTILDARDAGRLALDDPVKITREDLTLFHQPIASLVRGGSYDSTVGELLRRALTMSDNTANDRLLRYAGGPEAVRDFIRRKSLGEIKFGPGERLLQSKTAGLSWRQDYAVGNGFIKARSQLPLSTRTRAFENYIASPPDGATATAIAAALARLKRGELLSAESTSYLISTMESSRTGKQRLRGAVPPGWSFGHKTGTGQDLGARTAGYNDVGILIAPDGQSYAVAVLIGDTRRPVPERQALMQAVVGSLIANHRP